jgi:hypothetical protein
LRRFPGDLNFEPAGFASEEEIGGQTPGEGRAELDFITTRRIQRDALGLGEERLAANLVLVDQKGD